MRGARRTAGTQVHLLAPLDLHETVVTFDALHSQTAHAHFLVKDNHAHYIALIKATSPPCTGG